MYRYIKTIVQPINERGVWKEIDASGMLTKTISQQYAKAYFTVFSVVFNKEITFTLDTVKSSFDTFDGTFLEYLEFYKNKSFTESKVKPSIKRRLLRYEDGVKAGYKFYPSPAIADVTSNHDSSYRPYIKMVKKYSSEKGEVVVKAKEIYQSCLVSVNGYIHRLDVSDSPNEDIYIIDGNKTCLRSNDTCIGILSFQELGKLTVVPITRDMVYKQVADITLYEQCYVDLGIDTSNKTIILILGGYMHIQNWSLFRRISDTAIRIDFKAIPFFERYHESLKYLNLDDAPLDKGYDYAHASIEDLTSDNFIKYFLTLPQSFVVLLDNEDLNIKKHPVLTTKLPGKYISYIEPIYPLIQGFGKFGNYWSITDEGAWSVSVTENQYHNYMYRTSQQVLDNKTITDSRYSREPTEYSDAYFLEVSTMLSLDDK